MGNISAICSCNENNEHIVIDKVREIKIYNREVNFPSFQQHQKIQSSPAQI